MTVMRLVSSLWFAQGGPGWRAAAGPLIINMLIDRMLKEIRP
jgi:hypothetical protein